MCDVVSEMPVNMENLELIRLIDEKIIISENEKLRPNFPIFSSVELEKFDAIIQPLADELVPVIDKVSDEAKALIVKYVPNHLKEQAATVTKFNSSLGAVGVFMDLLVENERLVLPNVKTNLGIIGIIK